MRYTALALALLWAGWWVFFETAEAVGSHDFMQAIIFAVVMFGAVAIAWKWPAVGGALLLFVDNSGAVCDDASATACGGRFTALGET